MHNTQYINRFFAEFEVPELGTGVSDEPSLETVTSTQTQVAEPLKVPVSQTPAAVDLDALAAKFGDVVKSALPKPDVKAAPQLSPEEAKKLLNIWEPDDEFLNKFGNLETQKDAILAMRDGMTKQFLTIVQHMLQEQKQEFTGRYEPLLSGREARQQERVMNDFNTEYPALAKPELRPLISAVAQGLANRKFADQSEGFAELARGVEAVIKSHNPDFTLNGAQASSTKQDGQRPRVPVTTGGSGAGSGSGGDKGGKTGNGSVLSQYL